MAHRVQADSVVIERSIYEKLLDESRTFRTLATMLGVPVSTGGERLVAAVREVIYRRTVTEATRGSEAWWTGFDLVMRSFALYRNTISRQMKQRYGISWAEASGDDERLLSAFRAGEVPWAFVDWWGEKYDLDEVESIVRVGEVLS